jgi:protein gp37
VTTDNPKGYCYARRLATTRLAHLCPKCGVFEPHFHEERITQVYARQKPGIVFADPMADPWSDGMEQRWRDELLIACSDHPGLKPAHRFIILTKRPERITVADTKWMMGNLWLGVSITSGADWWRWEALAALPEHIHKFVSVEPLLERGVGTWIRSRHHVVRKYPEWVVVGSQSGKDAVLVDEEWQGDIRYACGMEDIPLFEKAGLPIVPAIRQMPADLASVFQKGGLS